jgi:lysozyme family protein
MSDFNLSINTILAHEGGWCCNPNDTGGETNFGISMRFIQNEGVTLAELGLSDLNPGSLKNLKVNNAKNIYKKYFWDNNKYSQINDQTSATKVFDACVNMGPKRAHILAQQAVNKLGGNLTVDGSLGPKSIAAINNCDPVSFVKEMANQMANFYQNLVKTKPQMQIFLKGWLKRAGWTK